MRSSRAFPRHAHAREDCQCSLCGIGIGPPFESARVVLDSVDLCHFCARGLRDYGYMYLGHGGYPGTSKVLVLDRGHLKEIRVAHRKLRALWPCSTRLSPEAAAAELLAASLKPGPPTGLLARKDEYLDEGDF